MILQHCSIRQWIQEWLYFYYLLLLLFTIDTNRNLSDPYYWKIDKVKQLLQHFHRNVGNKKYQLWWTSIMTDNIIPTVIRWVVLAFHSTILICRVVCQTRFDACQTKLFYFIWKWNEWIIEKRLKIMVCELFDWILNRKFTIFFGMITP